MLCSFACNLVRIFEGIFSFIFGDGDPNAGMDQRRIEAAAKVRRAVTNTPCSIATPFSHGYVIARYSYVEIILPEIIYGPHYRMDTRQDGVATLKMYFTR